MTLPPLKQLWSKRGFCLTLKIEFSLLNVVYYSPQSLNVTNTNNRIQSDANCWLCLPVQVHGLCIREETYVYSNYNFTFLHSVLPALVKGKVRILKLHIKNRTEQYLILQLSTKTSQLCEWRSMSDDHIISNKKSKNLTLIVL